MRIFIALGFTVALLSIGFPNRVQADDSVSPQEVTPMIIHNAAPLGGDIGVVNPENGKGSILREGAFTKVICRPESATGGSVLTDDRDQRKIGVWHASKDHYDIEFSES